MNLDANLGENLEANLGENLNRDVCVWQKLAGTENFLKTPGYVWNTIGH